MDRDFLENNDLVPIDNSILSDTIDYSKLSDAHAEIERLILLISCDLTRREDQPVGGGL